MNHKGLEAPSGFVSPIRPSNCAGRRQCFRVPELPEVEVLVRHLGPLLKNQTVRRVKVRRAKMLAPTSTRAFSQALLGARFTQLRRRGKYLLFTLRHVNRAAPFMAGQTQGSAVRQSSGAASSEKGEPLINLDRSAHSSRCARGRAHSGDSLMVGHLGMTGRMYLLPAGSPLPKHAAVVLELGRQNFVFEDTRYFGRLTLDQTALGRLGPEPLEASFNPANLGNALKRSTQPIKVKLLDQSVVAGIGNIYASESLFRAGISPLLPARRLKADDVAKLCRAIREVLSEAIAGGSTVPLNYAGVGERDGLFYFGCATEAPDYYEECLRVYDRAGLPCSACGTAIKRLVQAARSTYYCPNCQRR